MNLRSVVRIPLCAVLLAGLFAAPGAIAAAPPAEAGTVLKADVLKAEPFKDAANVATLKTGDKVEILQRQGGWFRVKSARGSGWLRMLSVRRGEAGKTSATGTVSGVVGLATGRAGTGNVVATTGIRGLDEEQLKAAAYDASALGYADSFVQSRTAAAKFAAEGKLAPRPVDYLPAPAK